MKIFKKLSLFATTLIAAMGLAACDFVDDAKAFAVEQGVHLDPVVEVVEEQEVADYGIYDINLVKEHFSASLRAKKVLVQFSFVEGEETKVNSLVVDLSYKARENYLKVTSALTSEVEAADGDVGVKSDTEKYGEAVYINDLNSATLKDKFNYDDSHGIQYGKYIDYALSVHLDLYKLSEVEDGAFGKLREVPFELKVTAVAGVKDVAEAKAQTQELEYKEDLFVKVEKPAEPEQPVEPADSSLPVEDSSEEPVDSSEPVEDSSEEPADSSEGE